MSRNDPYRSSTGSLSGAGAGGGRWDTERFLRERDRYERGRLGDDYDRHEDEYGRRLSGGFDDQDRVGVRAQASIGGRLGRDRVDEARVEVFHEEERIERDRRNPIFFEDHDPPARSAMVPYRSGPPRGRRQSIHVEREYVSPPPAPRAPPPKPKFIRRQSSLDTFDRRPFPRYGDREDFRQVVTVPTPPRRRRSPVRLVDEREYREVRVAEPDTHVHHLHVDHIDDDHFHHIHQDVVHHDHYEPPEDVYERERTTRSYRFQVEDDVVVPEAPPVRRGKTRIPRRLVEKTAIDMLGYPFEEEIDHIVILRPLIKEQIDELVNISKDIRIDRTKIVREEVKMIEAAPPPPPQPIERVERRTEIIIPPPQPPPVEIVREVIRTEEVAPPPPQQPSVHALSVHESSSRSDKRRKSRSKKRRSKSRRRASSSSSSSSSSTEVIITQHVEESEPVHGLFTDMFGKGGAKDEARIRKEIKALEIEEKAVKLEKERNRAIRRAEQIREGSDHGEKRVEIGGGIKVERNKKELNPRLVKAMLATLT